MKNKTEIIVTESLFRDIYSAIEESENSSIGLISPFIVHREASIYFLSYEIGEYRPDVIYDDKKEDQLIDHEYLTKIATFLDNHDWDKAFKMLNLFDKDNKYIFNDEFEIVMDSIMYSGELISKNENNQFKIVKSTYNNNEHFVVSTNKIGFNITWEYLYSGNSNGLSRIEFYLTDLKY